MSSGWISHILIAPWPKQAFYWRVYCTVIRWPIYILYIYIYRNDMGSWYCAINSPRGSRWRQKSRDRRSRDFCPHRGPSGELIAQYRPPMSFCFYPRLYLGNHLYFLKPDSSWKQQKNTLISEKDSVHSTKRVVMVTSQHLLVTS